MKSSSEILIATLVPTGILIVTCIVFAVLITQTTKVDESQTFACTEDFDCLNGGVCDVSSQTCTCEENWTGDNCAFWNATSATPTVNCSTTAVPCNTDENCENCINETSTEITCQEISADESNFNVAGSYCLPAKDDASACYTYYCDPSVDNCADQMPGRWYWQGWQG